MKTLRTKEATMICIVALCIVATIAFIGCKDEPNTQPQPVAQSKIFSGITTADGGNVNVTVNYIALPNTIPSYMSTLEIVINNVLPNSTATGNLTINIISSGNDGFTLASSKTLSARDTWIANATEQQMGISLDTIHSEWIK